MIAYFFPNTLHRAHRIGQSSLAPCGDLSTDPTIMSQRCEMYGSAFAMRAHFPNCNEYQPGERQRWPCSMPHSPHCCYSGFVAVRVLYEVWVPSARAKKFEGARARLDVVLAESVCPMFSAHTSPCGSASRNLTSSLALRAFRFSPSPSHQSSTPTSLTSHDWLCINQDAS